MRRRKKSNYFGRRNYFSEKEVITLENSRKKSYNKKSRTERILRRKKYALVAQLDRAQASDAWCRWFESNRVHHKTPVAIATGVLWCTRFQLRTRCFAPFTKRGSSICASKYLPRVPACGIRQYPIGENLSFREIHPTPLFCVLCKTRFACLHLYFVPYATPAKCASREEFVPIRCIRGSRPESLPNRRTTESCCCCFADTCSANAST